MKRVKLVTFSKQASVEAVVNLYWLRERTKDLIFETHNDDVTKQMGASQLLYPAVQVILLDQLQVSLSV